MKVLHVNMTYDYGSTGRFIKYVKEGLENQGEECRVVCGTAKGNTEGIFVTQSALLEKAEIVLGRLLGNHGLNCFWQTWKAIRFIDKFQPDVIHLHNLHGDYINFEMLFSYIKEKDIPIIWKLPDCWAFTGHCAYYDYVECYRWKEGCGQCPQKKQYPVSWIRDNSAKMLTRKKRAFSNVKKMVITPPSGWLKREAEASYLKQYEIEVVNNGIDLKSFYPVKNSRVEEIRKAGKIILLGVIFSFDMRKGLDYFNYLAEKLPDTFKIIIVGFQDKDHYMNQKITLVDRTENVKELAEYYSAADVFVNPTLEENFPSVNLEALACGTPIVAFRTGGATEAVTEKTGIVVERGDKEGLLHQVQYAGEHKPFASEDCVERAGEFTKERMIEKYLQLYRKVIGEPNA